METLGRERPSIASPGPPTTPVLDAGSVLLALTSDNTFVAFKPSKKEYVELAKYKVSDNPLTWASPVIADNRVFVKDRETLTLWTIQ